MFPGRFTDSLCWDLNFLYWSHIYLVMQGYNLKFFYGMKELKKKSILFLALNTFLTTNFENVFQANVTDFKLNHLLLIHTNIK